MTIEDVIHPDNAVVDSDIDIIVKIKIDAGTDGNSKLAFGILTPTSWDIAGSATMTLTTTADFLANVVNNEPMTVIPTDEMRDGLSWPAWFQNKFGNFDNTEPVEWVVFESSTEFQIHDKEEHPGQKVVNGTVDIKLHTGSRPMKPIMGYAFLGKSSGYDGGTFTKVLEVNDVRFASFGPGAFGFGDIFSIKYTEAHVTPAAVAHRGGNVYLLGKVKYETDGAVNEKTLDETNAKMLMEDLGEMSQTTSWQKYIYPKDFFDLPGNAVITEIVVKFANQDKSIITNEYNVEPACR
jgi:hypothetical protein